MATNNTGSRDPRRPLPLGSRHDPRNPSNLDSENRKRVASQSPAGGIQPVPKKNASASATDPRRGSFDNFSPAGSRRSSAQVNGNLTNGNAANNGRLAIDTSVANVNSPLSAATTALATAPGTNMNSGQASNSGSIVDNLPSQPSIIELLTASAQVAGKLAQAQNERDAALPELQKAKRQYDAMTQYFREFPAIREQHTLERNRAQKAFDKADKIVNLMQKESTRLQSMIANVSLNTPGGLSAPAVANTAAGPPASGVSAGAQQPDFPNITQDLDALKEDFKSFKENASSTKGTDALQQQLNGLESSIKRLDSAPSSKEFEALQQQLNGLDSKMKQQSFPSGQTAAMQVEVQRLSETVSQLGDLPQRLEDVSNKVHNIEKDQENQLDLVGSHVFDLLDGDLKEKFKEGFAGSVEKVEESFEELRAACTQNTNTQHQNAGAINKLVSGLEELRAALKETTTKAEVEEVQKTLANLSETVSRLQAQETSRPSNAAPSNPLNLVQFTPLAGPENEPDEADMPVLQRMQNEILALQHATEAHKRQVDNLTTDDVVQQMVGVMSTMYPDAKDVQSKLDKISADISQLVGQINAVSHRVSRLESDSLKGEVGKLRTEVNELTVKSGNHDDEIIKGTGAFTAVNEKLMSLRGEFDRLKGQFEKAREEAFVQRDNTPWTKN